MIMILYDKGKRTCVAGMGAAAAACVAVTCTTMASSQRPGRRACVGGEGGHLRHVNSTGLIC